MYIDLSSLYKSNKIMVFSKNDLFTPTEVEALWRGSRECHASLSGPLCKNYYRLIYNIWHIFGSYALVVPFEGHIAISYKFFPIIMKNKEKFHFFVSGPELLNGWTYLHENLS